MCDFYAYRPRVKRRSFIYSLKNALKTFDRFAAWYVRNLLRFTGWLIYYPPRGDFEASKSDNLQGPCTVRVTVVPAKLEQLAEQLHLWYLEATRELDPKSYNPNAQKAYNDLTDEQKFIDRYIAGKIMEGTR